jgi:hypothetical protein
MTIRNQFNLIGITALLVCIAVIFFTRQKSHEGKIFLHAVPVQTGSGWGYNIMADERVFIKQEYIPAVPGKEGFKSADDALLVANLVIHKISTNQLPTITTRELDSLGVLNNKK